MTRTGMGISKVAAIPFPANRDLNSAVLSQYTQSLHDVTLWDPSEATAVLSQGSTSYDLLSGLTENRYVIDGTLDPVLIGARQLDDGQLPSQDWTSLHVTYTHGYGAVVAAGDRATADGSPVAEVGGLPPASLAGAPSLGKAGSRVYFSPAGRQFVLVDTTEPEIDYEIEGTTQTAPPYSGGATIGVGAFLPRLAFAVKLHDFNLLVSDVVKPTTRVIYLTGTRQRVQKALPFMKVDADPYAVIAGNQLYWLYSAYVTSAYVPDATPADTSMLPAGSGLRGSYDYVRDAVVAVINARTGSMGFYDVDNDADPLLESYEASFPGLIQSTAALRQLAGGQIYGHLRYPQDLLTVQAATYGAYRPTAAGGPAGQAATQPSAGASWSLADSGNAGTPGAATTPYQPQYELVQWQPDQEPTFSLVQPLVSYAGPSGTGGDQMLTGLFVANSSPEHYGQLTVREVDSTNVPGPYVANEMLAKDDTELGDLAVGGNDVLGTIELLPVADSLLYVRPLYASVAGGDPVLEDVIVVYGKQVVIAPSVDAALSRIVHGGSGSVSPERPSAGELAVARTIRRDLEQAAADLSRAQHQLAERHLGAYQQDVDSAQQLIDAANRLEGSGAVPVAAAAAPTTRSTTRRGLLAGSGRPGGGSGPPGGGSGRSGGGSGRSGEGAGSTASGRPARTAARIPENASSRAGTAAGGAGTTGATSTSTTSALGGSTPTSEPATTLPGVPAATQASGGARRPAGATSPAGGGTGAPAAGLRDAPATTATTVVTSSAGPAPGSTSTAPPTSTSGPSASSTFTSTVPGSGRA
ncbi:MAG TPA: UPF0182 family protein, partial [Acidimicrobiales bacterium]|nr:UPF0182 family protein [Acidimicrobiales bacterium]